VDHLEAVTIFDSDRRPIPSANDVLIKLYRDPLSGHREEVDQVVEKYLFGELPRLAIYRNGDHDIILTVGRRLGLTTWGHQPPDLDLLAVSNGPYEKCGSASGKLRQLKMYFGKSVCVR
jgi:hypothetical protein